MGGFDSYLNGVRNIKMEVGNDATKKDKKEAIYDKVENRGIDEAPLDYGLVREDAIDVLLVTKSDARSIERYEERVNYYFLDSDLMESKARRYQKIAANEDGEVTRFANEHTNEYASKRINNANAASEHFTNAANLIKEFDSNAEGLTSRAIYEHRKAVMAERELAMRAAAVTKSKSSRHEKYLQAKASVSCIMTMLEQCERYEEKNIEKNEGADKFFKKEKAKLQARLKKEEGRLLKNAPTRDEMWEEKNATVLGEGAIRERKRKIRDEQHVNASDSDVALYSKLELLMKAKNEALPFERMVLRDENGAFISKGEMLKEMQNRDFREKVRTMKEDGLELKIPQDVLREMVKRVLNFNLPPAPASLSNKKDFLKWLNSDLTGNFEMLQKTIPEIEKEIENHGGEERIDTIPFMNFPGFKERFRFLQDLRTTMDDVLDGKFGIKKNKDDDGNDVYEMVPPEHRKRNVSLPKEFSKKYYAIYTKDREVREGYGGKKLTASEFEDFYELKKDDLNVPEVELESETDLKAEYHHYKTIRPSLSQEDFDFIHTYSKDLEITRYVDRSFVKSHIKGHPTQIFLHVTHRDKNGRPISEEDKENFEKTNNGKTIEHFANDVGRKKEFVLSQLKEIKQELDDFVFPEPERVTEDWVNNLIMAKTEEGIKKRRKIMELCIRVRGVVAMSKARGSEQLYKNVYDKFIQDNPEMEDKCVAMEAIDSIIGVVAAKHGYEEPSLAKSEPVQREKELDQRREWEQKLETTKKRADARYEIQFMKRKYDYSKGNLGNLQGLKDKQEEGFNAIRDNNPLVSEKLIRIRMKNAEVCHCYEHPLIKKLYHTLVEAYGFRPKDVGISRSMGIGMKKVHYDNNWVPLTKEDKEAHEHNVKWLEAFIRIEKAKVDGEPLPEDAVKQKREMVLNAYEDFYRRLSRFKFPTKMEIQNGWVEKLTPDQVEEYWDLQRLSLGFGCVPEKGEYKDYKEDILKVQRRYPEHTMLEGMLFSLNTSLTSRNLKETGSFVFDSAFISSTRPGEYKSVKSTVTKRYIEQHKHDCETLEEANLNQYEESREKYDEFMKLDENERMLRYAHKPLMEKYNISFNLIKFFIKAKETGMTAKDPKLVEWMNELKTIGFTDGMNLTRTLGTGLRLVHYDKNGQPKTEKDRENQELNEKWLKSFNDLEEIGDYIDVDEQEEEKKIRTFQKEHLKGMMTNYLERVKSYKYPTEQEIRNGWFENLTTEQQEEFFDLKRLSVAFSSKPEQDKIGQTEMVTTFYKDHPAFKQYVQLWNHLSSNVYTYLMSKYGITYDNFVLEDGVLKEKGSQIPIENNKRANAAVLGKVLEGYLQALDEVRQKLGGNLQAVDEVRQN